jgi:hypothetical protein
MKLEREFMKLLTILALGTLSLVPAYAAALRDTPGLTAIRLFEVSGSVIATDLVAQGGGLDIKAANFVGSNANSDYSTPNAERFDLYYSDAAGNFNLNGEYVTIDCFMDNEISGCNVAALQLVFGSTPGALADVLTRAVTTQGYVANSELLAVDGSTSTYALLGSSGISLMSLTVGFSGLQSSAVPEPSTYALMGAGLIGLAYFNKKRK